MLLDLSGATVTDMAGAMRSLWVGVAMAALLLSACGSKKPLVAKPTAGDGVRVELSSHEYDDDDLNLLLRVVNDLPDTIVVDLHAIVAVLPNGEELARTDGKRYFTLWGGLSRYVRVEFESENYDLREAPGIWLRFDGVYVGQSRVKIPPMALVSPQHPAGSGTERPAPPLALEEFNKGRNRPTAYAGGPAPPATTATLATTASSPPPRASIGYTGPRLRIKALDTKVAAMPLKPTNVPANISFIMDDLLLTELQSVGFQAIGPEDINAMLGFENMKEETGCDDATCVAELGNALGVPYLTAGNIANIEGSTVITLKLINVRTATVVARVSKMSDAGIRSLPRVIAEAVQELVQRSGM